MTTDTSEVGHLVKLNAYFTRVTGGAWSNTLQVTWLVNKSTRLTLVLCTQIYICACMVRETSIHYTAEHSRTSW